MALINGRQHDWSDVKLYMDGVPVAEVTAIEYRESQEAELQYAGGRYPVGVGYGNYKVEGSFTLTRAAAQDFEAPARALGKRPFDYAPFVIVVAYADKVVREQEGAQVVEQTWDETKTDRIINVVITEREESHDQNAKQLVVRYSFIAERIE